MKKIKKSKNDWEYFDNCGICQAMEEADKKGGSLNLEELESAFAKQNLKNKLKERIGLNNWREID